jgi:hypothetical protein
MRTNIDLQDELVDEAMALTGTRTKREVVELALRELVARRRRPSVSAIFALGGLDPKYDHKKARGGESLHRVEQPLVAYQIKTAAKGPARKISSVKKAR